MHKYVYGTSLGIFIAVLATGLFGSMFYIVSNISSVSV